MKKLNLVTVLSLTAGLAFAWNATAVDNIYGIYEDQTTGAWYGNFQGGLVGGSEIGYLESSTFTALHESSVLSLSIERNSTANGFSFGTYTYDSQTGRITGTTLLGTVDGNGSTTVNAAAGVTASGSTAYSGAFKANEVVGLWVQETGSDLVYLSDNSQTLKYGANSKTVADYIRGNVDTYNGSNYFDEEEYNALAKAYRDDYIAGLEAKLAELENENNPDNADKVKALQEEIARDKAYPELIPVTEATFSRMQYTEGYVDGTANDKAFGRATVWFDDSFYDGGQWDRRYGYPGQETEAAIKIHLEGVAPGLASDPSEKGPNLGSPLPGVWATIALAGAASAYLKRRRKENK